MRRYWLLVAGLLGFFLTGFLVVEAFGVPWLSEPPPRLGEGPGPAAAVLAVGLLIADAVLPVPASLVMVALGGTYGVALGAVLALVGRSAGTLLGFALGRWGRPLLEAAVPGPGAPAARPGGTGASRLLSRWGALAIVASRPVPLVAETVAVLAGASAMPWRRAVPAAVAGSLPEAVLYSWAGASTGGTASAAWLWTALLVVAVVVWAITVPRRVADRDGLAAGR